MELVHYFVVFVLLLIVAVIAYVLGYARSVRDIMSNAIFGTHIVTWYKSNWRLKATRVPQGEANDAYGER